MTSIASFARKTWTVGANPLGPFDVTAFRGSKITALMQAAIWSGTGALATLTFTFDTGETFTCTISPSQIEATGAIAELFVDNAAGTARGAVQGPGKILRAGALVCGCSVPCPSLATTLAVNLQVVQALNVSLDLTSP